MAPERCPRALTSRTKAIVPVHLFGQTADMDPILKLAGSMAFRLSKTRPRPMVLSKGRRAAQSAKWDASAYPEKSRRAGRAEPLSRIPELADKIRILRDHGQARKYHHAAVG